MKYLAFSIIALIAFAVTVQSQTTRINRDFQVWTETSVTIPLIKSKDKNDKSFDRAAMSISGTLRLGRNSLHPVDERIGIGFSYRLNKYLSFSPDALYRAQQPFAGVKAYESRFRFAVNLENKWKKFSLSDRNQIEYRLRNSRGDSVRYKNRLRLNVPVKKNGVNIVTPFVSDEPYYDFQAKKFTRNEFFAGINKSFNKNFSTDLFYLFVVDTGLPKTVNGIGVNLKFKIN